MLNTSQPITINIPYQRACILGTIVSARASYGMLPVSLQAGSVLARGLLLAPRGSGHELPRQLQAEGVDVFSYVPNGVTA